MTSIAEALESIQPHIEHMKRRYEENPTKTTSCCDHCSTTCRASYGKEAIKKCLEIAQEHKDCFEVVGGELLDLLAEFRSKGRTSGRYKTSKSLAKKLLRKGLKGDAIWPCTLLTEGGITDLWAARIFVSEDSDLADLHKKMMQLQGFTVLEVTANVGTAGVHELGKELTELGYEGAVNELNKLTLEDLVSDPGRKIEYSVRNSDGAYNHKLCVYVRENQYTAFHYLLERQEKGENERDGLQSACRGGLKPILEVQVRTPIQHEWSEVDHELNYKPIEPGVSKDLKNMLSTARKVAGVYEHMAKRIKNMERLSRNITWKQVTELCREATKTEPDNGGEKRRGVVSLFSSKLEGIAKIEDLSSLIVDSDSDRVRYDLYCPIVIEGVAGIVVPEKFGNGLRTLLDLFEADRNVPRNVHFRLVTKSSLYRSNEKHVNAHGFILIENRSEDVDTKDPKSKPFAVRIDCFPATDEAVNGPAWRRTNARGYDTALVSGFQKSIARYRNESILCKEIKLDGCKEIKLGDEPEKAHPIKKIKLGDKTEK